MIRATGLTLALLACFGLCSFSATAQNAKNWGVVKGRIVFGGPVPKRGKLDDFIKEKAPRDHADCLKNGSILEEKWVVNEKNKGLRWTFVWLAPEGKGALPIHPTLKNPPKDPVVIDQPLCMFIPHALGLREGQLLLVKNTSTIGHNFKWGGDPDVNPGNNVIMAPGGDPLKITNLKADRLPVSIECNIHPWMNGKIMVFDHPYYMVTDENGNFEIKDAPAGNFRIIARHSTGLWLGGAEGRKGKAITVKGGQTNDLGDWEFPASK
jgi:hypothetical protein